MAKKKFTNGDDKWKGSNGVDDVNAKGGDDNLNGKGGNDILLGGSGNDTIKGGAGDDRLIGGSGDDKLNATVGNDTVDGGTGDDRVIIAGNFADATVEMDGAYYAITIGAVTTRVKNVELFQFDDGFFDDGEIAAAVGGGGTTFTLTTAQNTVDGTDGDDTIDGTAVDTWSAFDDIDGGDGTDSMTALLSGTTVPGSTTVVNVENLTVNSTGAGFTINTTGYTGLTNLVLNNTNAAGDQVVTAATTTAVSLTASSTVGDITLTGGMNVTVSGTAADDMLIDGAVGTATVTGGAEAADIVSVDAQGLTSVTILDGGIIAIGDGLDTLADVTFNDDATTDTLTTVAIAGNLGASTINSDVLTSLTLADSNQNSTVTAAAGTRALALSINKLTGGTIDDATATSIAVATTGTASTGVTIDAAAATAATIAADVALTATLTLDVATSLAISGDSLVTLTALTDTDSLTSVTVAGSAGLTADLSAQTALTSVDASGTSGANTVTINATTSTYAGGSGVDTVSVLAQPTKSISGGAGTDDVFVWNVNGSYTTDTDVTNFEVIAAGALVNADTIDATGYTRLQQGAVAGAVTWSNVAANSTLTINASPGFGTTVNLASTASTSDVFNVSLTAAAAIAADTLTVAGVETVNFLTDDSATASTGIEHSATLTDADAKAITVTGDAGLTLTFTGTALTSFDASGVTDGDVTWTSGALASAATVKGGATADANVFVFSAALGNITYTGGSGTDTITMNHATNHDATTNTFTLGNGANTLTAGNNDGTNTVTGGTGVDIITLGNGTNTITVGDGNDIVTVGTGGNTIDLGAGNDTLTVGASTATSTVTLGAGTDTIILAGVQASAGAYVSAVGAAAGDIFDFSANANDAGGLAAGALGAKISLGGAATFTDYLNAATAGNGGTDSAFAWFQLNGDTYVVLDNDAAATFQSGVDQVVEIDGLVDLSTSTQDGSYVLTL